MEFLSANYIWIIVAVVIILMTIIGYIAEKTDFGRKEFEKREKKVKEKKTKEKKTVTTEVPASVGLENSEATNNVPMEVEPAVIEENSEVKFGEPLADDMEVSSPITLAEAGESSEPVENLETPLSEDLNVPLEDTKENSEKLPTQSEDLNAPFGDNVVEGSAEDLNQPFSDEAPKPMEEDLNVPFGDDAAETENSEVNIDLPDIDSVKEDVSNSNEKNESEDDDIWKF